jgi:hypothetical protein
MAPVVRVLLLLCLAGPAWSQRWALQYFYDRDDFRLQIADFRMMSAQRGLAVGTLRPVRDGRPQPVAMVTRDGGQSWTEVKLRETPVSLFFLNETTGWLVTDNGLWRTDESGFSWRKLKRAEGWRRVHFFDEQRGFAIGYPKLVTETRDGGQTWKELALTKEIAAKPENTIFTSIAFAGPRGIISGVSVPPRRMRDSQRLPAWMEPEEYEKERQWPTLLITLESNDRGQSWKSQTAPAFGAPWRLRLSGDMGLGLFRFENSFAYPSEVYLLSLKTGKSTRLFRASDRKVTDLDLFLGAPLLAAVEPPGKLHQLPLPGKLKMLRYEGEGKWREDPVDYRASGQEAILSVAGREAWVALDSGMILKFQPADAK